MFTPKELAEMAIFDAEIDDKPLTMEEIRESRERDKAVLRNRKSKKQRKIAERQRAYYEANREKITERQRAYYEANREKIAESQQAYYETNPGKHEAHKAYMREYARKRYAAKKKEEAGRDQAGH